MAVIFTIAIVSAVIVTSTTAFKDKPRKTAIASDAWNLQSAIDLYQLDHHGKLPVLEEKDDSSDLALGNPKTLDFDAIHPKYIRSLPQIKGMYYWVDYQGKLYYSTLESPRDFKQNEDGLSWTEDEDAGGYKVYEVQTTAASSASQSTLVLVAQLNEGQSPYKPKGYSMEKIYLINVTDEYGYDAPPIRTHNPSIVAGGYHALIVDESGSLLSYGYNQYGQLGHEENIGTDQPTTDPVKVMTDVKSVSGGMHHTLVIKEDDSLWSFGSNQYGQLGHSENLGTAYPNIVPKQIMTGVKAVIAGHYHTLVIKKNGELFSFGHNFSGQLGHTNNLETHAPNENPKSIMQGVRLASAGNQHSLVVKEDGTLWSFGLNYHGQLGDETNSRTYIGNPIPQHVKTGVQSVAAGAYHSLAVLNNGELWSFGNNTYGQLGSSGNSHTNGNMKKPTDIVANIRMVSGGSHHSLILSEDGEFQQVGQIALDPFKHQIENGSHSSNPAPRHVANGIKSIASGHFHSLFIDDNNELWTFGYNRHEQLGYHVNNSSGNDKSDTVDSSQSDEGNGNNVGGNNNNNNAGNDDSKKEKKSK